MLAIVSCFSIFTYVTFCSFFFFFVSPSWSKAWKHFDFRWWKNAYINGFWVRDKSKNTNQFKTRWIITTGNKNSVRLAIFNCFALYSHELLVLMKSLYRILLPNIQHLLIVPLNYMMYKLELFWMKKWIFGLVLS